MKVYGMIYDVDLNLKMVSIKKNNRLIFYYFQNSLMHMFKRYLYTGNIICLEYDENKLCKKGNKEGFMVLFLYSICSPNIQFKKYYYDKHLINSSLKDFLNGLNSLLFLDLEMTMPPYGTKRDFPVEIIQAGMLLMDSNSNKIIEKDIFIKSSIVKKINSRTQKFLNLDKEKYSTESIGYLDFYKYFKNVLEKYKPTIIVYGKNDILFLERSYVINRVPSLKEYCRFVNLNQLIRNYYDLKNDPGLFKIYQFYNRNELNQVHDALEDSLVTMKVFNYFKKDVNEELYTGDDLRRYLD